MSPKSELENFSRIRQSEIYLEGVRGKKPSVPTSYGRLREKARRKLSKKAFNYIAGAAGTESTKKNNRKSFNRYSIVPNMLRDVSERDPRATLFDMRLPAPFLLAPVGVLELAHPRADLAVAEAASSEEIPMVFSSQASYSMERCAERMEDTPRWFQLYWSTSDRLVKSLVRRAENCGCSAIVLTLDTTLLGWRPQDQDEAYLPFLRGMGIAQYTSDPVFREMMDDYKEEDSGNREVNFSSVKALIQMSRNYPGPFLKNLTSGKPLRAVRTFINTYSRPSLEWNDLEYLKNLTELPILLKGILSPADARKAIQYGIDGIIVSNHGGRQVDGAISSLETLPAIADAVDRKIPILLDSGIRSGADIFKALALGADAVFIGRPYVYGLAASGKEGAREVIRNYRADFELTMALAGCRNVDEVQNRELKRSG